MHVIVVCNRFYVKEFRLSSLWAAIPEKQTDCPEMVDLHTTVENWTCKSLLSKLALIQRKDHLCCKQEWWVCRIFCELLDNFFAIFFSANTAIKTTHSMTLKCKTFQLAPHSRIEHKSLTTDEECLMARMIRLEWLRNLQLNEDQLGSSINL